MNRHEFAAKYGIEYQAVLQASYAIPHTEPYKRASDFDEADLAQAVWGELARSYEYHMERAEQIAESLEKMRGLVPPEFRRAKRGSRLSIKQLRAGRAHGLDT